MIMDNTPSEVTREEWEKMDLKELEEQYSPSRWSPRYSADEIIQAHIKVVKICIEEVRLYLPLPPRLDVSYGDAPRAKLDVYGEDLPGDSPIMVYVHGGYWQELNKDLSVYSVRPLHKAGVVTVVVGYDLAPQVSVEEIVEEIRSAVSWSCDLAKKRGSRGVTLSGWSAGGQLITQVLSTWQCANETTRDLVRGVVTFSGIFDLRPLVKIYVNDPLHLTESSAWELSPLRSVNHLTKLWPRMELLIAVGEHDSPEFRRQSLQYSQVCKRSGLKSEYMEVKDADHFNIVENLSKEEFSLTQKMIQFVGDTTRKEDLKTT